MRFYVDTCIWRDYHENRSDRFRPLGDWAFSFLNLVVQKQWILMYSNTVIDELKKKYSLAEIQSIFEMVANQLIKSETKSCHIREAKSLSRERNVALADALHAILARDNKAIIVSRDNHFMSLTDVAPVRKPEELI